MSSIDNATQLYIKHGFKNFCFDVVVCTGKINNEEVKKFTSSEVEVKRVTEENLTLLVNYTSNIMKKTNLDKYFQMFVASKDVVACVALKKSASDNEGIIIFFPPWCIT